MERDYWKKTTEKYYKQRNIAISLLLVMVVCNGMLSLSVLLQREKTIIVPAYLRQTVWTQGELVSETYLEEMSIFFSQLLLDATPHNYRYKRDLILRYVSPEYHNVLEKQLIEEEERLRKENLTTSFLVKKIIVGGKNYQAKVIGILTKYVAGQKVSQSEEEIMLRFEYSSGILTLREFKRIDQETN